MPLRRRRPTKKSRKQTLSKKVANVQKQVRFLNRTNESKQVTVPLLSTTATVSAPYVYHLSQIAAGDEEFHRDGVQVTPTSVDIRMIITSNSAGAESEQLVRFLVFQDKQQVQGTTPTALQLLGTSAPTIQDEPNFINHKRFSILLDRVYTVGQSVTGSFPSASVPYKKYIHFRPKLLKKNLEYYSNAANDIQKNGLYIMMITRESTNPPSMAGQSALRFRG